MKLQLKLKLMTIMALIGFASSAQPLIEIGLHGGYIANSKIQFFEGTLDIDDNPSMGIHLGANLSPELDIELDYTWSSSTDIRFNTYDINLWEDFETRANVHYVMLNSLHKLPVSESFAPFFLVGLGAGIFDTEIHGAKTAGRFTINLGAGAKFYLSDRVGLRLSAKMMMPMYFQGAGFYTGIGTGGVSSGLSLNSTVAFLAGDFSGGIFLRLGEN